MEKNRFEIDDLFSFKRIVNVKILPEKNILFEEQQMSQNDNNYTSAIFKIKDANPGAEIKITSFYDSKTQSGFHICKHCNNRFETDGTLSHCPYCNGSIYGDSTNYR